MELVSFSYKSILENNSNINYPPFELYVNSSKLNLLKYEDIMNNRTESEAYIENYTGADIEIDAINEEETPNQEIETYIATLDMSHYTNEIGTHVPKHEGGARDRKGNPLVAYDSIAIPKKLYKDLPYGSEVKLVTSEGDVYYGTVVDTGSALNKLNRIDRCVGSYKEVNNLGVIKNVKIYKIEKE